MSVRRAYVLGLIALLPAAARAVERLTLVEDGRPVAVIVTPAEPNAGEKRAASELQSHLKEASGAKLPIVADRGSEQGPAIVLGRACRGVQDLPAGDGFVIRTMGDRVLIAGRGERGTLYGVCAFLEEPLGVRWYMPGNVGTVIPKARSISIGPIDRKETPSFEYRWIGPGREWSARNRNNVGLPKIGVNVFRSAHTFSTFLDPRKYFDEHPEWYALVGGVRRRDERLTHGNQICTSNPEAVAQVIANMRQFLSENPDVDVVTLFANDGNWFCECPTCKAMDEPDWAAVEEVNSHGRALGVRGSGTLSRRLMMFNNTVAEALYQTHPRVKVKVGAYSCYTSPPRDLSLKHFKNIIVQICHSWCHNHAVTDPSCPINVDFRRAMEGWLRITPGGVMLYEYYFKAAQCELPFPIIHAMREEFRYFEQIGVKGVYTQYTENWGTLMLPYYVASRLAWNHEADIDTILDELYEEFYGPAAAPMKKYYERLEQAAVDSKLHLSPPYFRFPELFTAECLADCRRHLETAEKLAHTEAIHSRLAIVAASLKYTELVTDYVHAVRAIDGKIGQQYWRSQAREEVFEEASRKAQGIRQFLARPPAENVFRKNSSYVDRLLDPRFTYRDRWGEMDSRQLQEHLTGALTRRDWLARTDGAEACAVAEKFDLWIYGYDFDADPKGSEHRLRLLGADDKPVAELPLPPEGQACNGQAGCVIYEGLVWPDPARRTLKLEVVNLPGNWSSSTLFAFYVMPGGLKISPTKAAALIRQLPDWPRRNSIGFVELGGHGQKNADATPVAVSIELIGRSKETPQRR